MRTCDQMRLALITLTEQGIITCKRVIDGFSGETRLFLPQKFNGVDVSAEFYEGSLGDLTAGIFHKYSGIVFVMAMGIVVRVIARNIKDKYCDPAVLVVDDVGRYVISALSGHEGGANELSCRVANILHTDAVITTGSESVKDVIVGIGCRRGASAGDIRTAIDGALARSNISLERVRLLSTIDLKADEAGLLAVSDELNIPLRVVSREEIDSCAIDYKESEFVKETIGVGAVCEPAAILGGRKARLVLAKQRFQGITVAIAVENLMW